MKIKRRAALSRFLLLKRYSRLLGSFVKQSDFRKVLNFLSVNIQYHLKKERVRGYPYIAQIEPVNLCQLKCPTCPTGLGVNPDPPGKMELSDFKKTVDPLKEYLYEILLFGFGEPFLHKDIFDMIKYASGSKIRTVLSTNLCHLKNGDIDKIIDSGLELIVVSLDGFSQETYRKYRVNGDVEIVKQNIEAIMKRKRELSAGTPVIQIQFIVMDHNRHEISETMEFGKRLGVEEFILKDFGPRYVPHKTDHKEIAEKSNLLRTKMKKCHRLWREVYIAWNGEVRPCCLTFDGSMGNILIDDFTEIWNSEKFRASRRILGNESEYTPDFHVPCLSCHLLDH